MDIRIGVTHSSRDISLEVEGDEKSQAAVRKTVEEALAGKVEVLWMKDKRGREVAIPAEKIAFVECDDLAVFVWYGFGAFRAPDQLHNRLNHVACVALPNGFDPWPAQFNRRGRRKPRHRSGVGCILAYGIDVGGDLRSTRRDHSVGQDPVASPVDGHRRPAQIAPIGHPVAIGIGRHG